MNLSQMNLPALKLWRMLDSQARSSSDIPLVEVTNAGTSPFEIRDALKLLIDSRAVIPLYSDELLALSKGRRIVGEFVALAIDGNPRQFLRIIQRIGTVTQGLIAQRELLVREHCELSNVLQMSRLLLADIEKQRTIAESPFSRYRELLQESVRISETDSSDAFFIIPFPFGTIYRLAPRIEECRNGGDTSVISAIGDHLINPKHFSKFCKLSFVEIIAAFDRARARHYALETAVANLEHSLNIQPGTFTSRISDLKPMIGRQDARLTTIEAELKSLDALINLLSQSEEVSDRPGREAISKAVQQEVWQRDQGRCVQCGGKERLEYDHIIPHSKGGSNTSRNLQLLCELCNRSKGDRI